MSKHDDATVLGGIPHPTVIVLLSNDCVIGVYTSESKAEEASQAFLKERYKETWRCPSYIDRRSKEGEEEFKRFIRQTLFVHTRSKNLDATPTTV